MKEQPESRPRAVEATHHGECWRYHAQCAQRRCLDFVVQVDTQARRIERDALTIERLRNTLAQLADECDCDGAPDARTNHHGDALGPHVCMYHRIVNEGGPA